MNQNIQKRRNIKYQEPLAGEYESECTNETTEYLEAKQKMENEKKTSQNLKKILMLALQTMLKTNGAGPAGGYI